jgi:hypothetical protein
MLELDWSRFELPEDDQVELLQHRFAWFVELGFTFSEALLLAVNAAVGAGELVARRVEAA